MSSALPKSSKVLRLPTRRMSAADARISPADARTSRMAARVRTHLSLLQGYADIMEGLSPRLKIEILQVMAEKTRELGATLHPFLEQSPGQRPPIGDYRQVRDRTRQLISDYRVLLERLHNTVSEAHGHAAGGSRLAKM
jgi:hypothetical protein